MAGHKMSGYILSLWQALFAAFRKVFTRLLRLVWSSNNNNKTSKSSPDQEQAALDSSEPTTAAQSSSAPETTGTAPATGTEPSPANAADPPPAAASHLSNPPDLERGDLLSQPEQNQENQQSLQQEETSDGEDMAASKKRGNKRSGVKANAAQSPAATVAGTPDAQQRDKENMGPGKSFAQTLATSSPAPTADKVPLGTSDQANTAGTREGLQQSVGQKLNGARSYSSVSAHPASSSGIYQERPDSGSARQTPNTAGSQTPVETSVAPSENLGAGSYSQVGAQDPDAVGKDDATKVTKGGHAPRVDAQVDQVAAAVDRLNIIDDNTPGPEKALTKDTAAVEAAGVPVVAANANPGQPLIALKPLAPLVTPPSQVLPGLIEPTTEEGKRERAIHLNFMREALAMGDAALTINETPVGCVLVYKNRIIAKGMNATNITRNGTRHAEFMALSALLSHPSDADVKDVADHDEAMWGDVDPADGHIYPYGQKLHPSPKVDRSIVSECILYVTVEPCVMCASLLRQLRVKKVYFGAVNDKFGGTGGVFRIHTNSKPVTKPSNERPHPIGYGPQEMSTGVQRGRAAMIIRDEDDGDGGNVEPGYPAEGGFLRDEAVSLLRRFYVQENGRAPQPRKKEGRAARLFAMENAAANGGVVTTDADGNIISDSTGTGTPTTLEGDATPVSAT
ncbi:hypothetical protein BJ166DRAFT_368257 [Pestalotiopsis sp. NC0098]|nr:hypothetical protein BJ166DRAFT_368257 [Pestalotiopsis sp. NC0098]